MSSYILVCRISKDLLLKIKCILSAQIKGLEYVSILGISLIYIKQSNGPNIKPCGTSNDMCSTSEIAPFSLTYSDLFDK